MSESNSTDKLIRYMTHEFPEFIRVDDMPDDSAAGEALALIKALHQSLADVLKASMVIIEQVDLESNLLPPRSAGVRFDGNFATINKGTVRDLKLSLIRTRDRLERPLLNKESDYSKG